MSPRTTGRFTLGVIAVAGCGLAAVLLGRPEVAALALPFVVAAGAGLLAPEPDLRVSVRLGDGRIVMGDTTTLTVELPVRSAVGPRSPFAIPPRWPPIRPRGPSGSKRERP